MHASATNIPHRGQQACCNHCNCQQGAGSMCPWTSSLNYQKHPGSMMQSLCSWTSSPNMCALLPPQWISLLQVLLISSLTRWYPCLGFLKSSSLTGTPGSQAICPRLFAPCLASRAPYLHLSTHKLMGKQKIYISVLEDVIMHYISPD